MLHGLINNCLFMILYIILLMVSSNQFCNFETWIFRLFVHEMLFLLILSNRLLEHKQESSNILFWALICHHSLFCWSFSIWLKSPTKRVPNHYPEHLFFRRIALRTEFRQLFFRFEPKGRISQIKPPLKAALTRPKQTESFLQK